VAEAENVYVKIGERGRLLERTAGREIDHANLRANGWVLKGSKGAPTRKDETADKVDLSGLSDAVPTSGRAYAADTGSSKTSSSGAAGAAADAKSQAAAGS
jgi:hypothetical protein